tara:strand:+ start:641 stop:1441 length:801 start_codon:yes stop_codon:yes gene_type:complete
MTKMNIKGFSGCKVELLNGKVLKTSSGPLYNDRLKRQKEKQEKFQSELHFLRSPVVYSSKINSFLMEYIAGKDFISFLTENSKTDIEKFAEQISSYVFENLSKCVMKAVHKSIIQKKLKDVQKKRSLLCLPQFLELTPEYIEIPVGISHGDLTLSNIIFKDKKLILIDFLDGFIETPLMDMAKIRQDTCYKWSLGLHKKNFDLNKANIALDYLDKLLHNNFLMSDSYKNFYLHFQFINFARILPYAKEINTINYIRGILSGIVNKL